MSAKSILVMVTLLVLTGIGFWNLERFEGCTGNSQSFELEMGRKRYVRCSEARVHYVGQNSGTEMEVECGGKVQRAMIYKGSGAELCDMRVMVRDTWQGGPVTKWNANVFITWK